MRFIISSTTLLKGLQSINGVISSNNTLPILDDFLFQVSDEILTVSASDLETTMTIQLPLSMVEEPGNITIPAKLLLETLKTFGDIPLTFNIDMQTLQVEISAGEGKFKLSGHQADEYPQVPKLTESTKVSLPAPLLARAINMTLFATGNDDLRPVMTGVYCLMSPENITFVATDAHKLVRYRRNDAQCEEERAIILPKKPLNQLKGVLSHTEEMVNVEFNEENARFSFNNVTMTCRLIEGKYPNYEAVIPTENPNKLIIDRHLLQTCMKRVSLFASQATYQVRFKITGQELIISAEDLDFSNEAKERLSCSYEGEDMEIGFNSRFMLEMLNNLNSEQIILEMSQPNRAGILAPVDPENTDEDILMLVMPVVLSY